MADEAKAQVKQFAMIEMQEKSQREKIDRLRQLHESVIDRLREINLVKDYGGYVTEIVAPIEVRPR